MSLLYLATAVVGAVVLVYFYINWKLQYWKQRGVPYVEPEFYYGNVKGFGEKFHLCDIIQQLYKSLKHQGPIGGTYWYTRPKLLVTDLDLIKQILVKDFQIFHNRGMYHNEVDDPLSANLNNLEDGAWRNLRTKVTPVFTSSKTKIMFELIIQKADRLVKKIDEESNTGKSIEIKNIFIRYTIDATASVAYGIESRALDDDNCKFLEISARFFSRGSVLYHSIIQANIKLARWLRICSVPKDVSQFYLDTIREVVKYREENPDIIRNDFMSMMLKLKDPSQENPLTFNQLAALSTEFMVAGYEGSSTILTFCLYEFALSENIQEKVRESVKQSMEKHNGVLSYDCVADMKYLDQCVNETLRKYPTVVVVVRIAKEDYKVPNSDIVIEKGMRVQIPTHAIQHDPEIYPDPSKFDPDRFSPEEVAKRHQFAFLSFGEGPRMCIGVRFAMLQMKVALAKILLNFKVVADKTAKKTDVYSKSQPMFLSAAGGYFVKFQKL